MTSKERLQSGIYLLERIDASGQRRIYIGQAIDLKRRRRQYDNPPERDMRHIMRAIRKHGRATFKWRVLEHCAADMLNERERYWITRFNACHDQRHYNHTEGGDSGGALSAAAKAKVTNALKARWANPDNRAKHRASMKAALNRPDVKARRALTEARPEVKARRKAALNRPEVKARRKAALNRPDVKARRALTEARPEVKARRSKAAKAAHAKRTPAEKAKTKAARALTEARPEVKAMRSASQKRAQNRPDVRTAKSARLKALYENPDERAALSAAWTPDKRAAQSARLKAAHARRRVRRQVGDTKKQRRLI
ncbi:MAG: GIY-YIG nuclease family protein [Candidatus Poribacteria bacterium]|nr:GIY-YIG nuclease family protein [Candidatus Poribacteria bacterium]